MAASSAFVDSTASLNENQPPEKRQKLDVNNSCHGLTCVNEFQEALAVKTVVANACKPSVKETKTHRSEYDVGISQFCSAHEGFSGILKQRYSDFLVNEINFDGETVHFTSTELPEVFIQEEIENSVLPSEVLQKLKEFINTEDKTSTLVVATEDDKEQRTLIHREIRQKFPMLESDTADVEGHKVVRTFYPNQSDNKRRRKNDWPRDRGEYCHLVLYKENRDTMQAINLLAKCLKIKPDRFSYAGTKDGRAITVQSVSVFRIDARNLQGLNKVLNNIRVGNFEFKKTPLKLGELKGNTFVVVLRNVDGSNEQIESAMLSLSNLGFINYYGLQRFGSSKNATHNIGLCLLKGEWSKAIDMILGSRSDQDNILNKVYEHWTKTKNPKESLQMLEGKKCLETFLLEGLSKCGKDLVAALKVLPRNTRLMYVHAYQSYIWNVVVSRRIKNMGFEPVVGDLVFDKTKPISSLASAPPLLLTKGSEEFLIGSNKFLTGTGEFFIGFDDQSTTKEKVKTLSLEDINSYTIQDIILPLPGYDVEYPQHEAKTWYEELLSHDGLDVNNMRHKVKDYSLSGAYRHVIVRPDNVKWEIVNYDDPTVALVRTDYDRLTAAPEPVSVSDGKYRALKMEFDLPSSSYATMLVREILKQDTSPSYHSTLNTN